ncbi:rhodanese-like domain-containing protein [Aurantimonas sp. VKM B-3413]|uniref:rhodanese-like domain-containing protein n=1 Tax=Aurantimonas sp. VKM B-3413 TaxID=2779401 RepID=UPI001E585B7E|nr:rhodanese-like domain-containing protein [Aurantimonas sp. VKM B-3413]MCB8838408.1 rhodanese-like domain-containing protein [Aurantimonas sp. VKM B-3413]
MSAGYKGDVGVRQCWSTLAETPDAVLVDVRTVPEWTYVGIPELSSLGKAPVLMEWQSFPSMTVDPHFAETLAKRIAESGGNQSSPIFFLCRSGVRSMASAAALTAAGYENCFNVLDGFEGPLDETGHRGSRGGWKAEGLPWVQR